MMYLIFSSAVLLPMLLVVVGLLIWRFLRSLDRRRAPFNIQLVNLPGDGLRRRIARHEEKLLDFSGMISVAGPTFLALWLLARIDKTGIDWTKIRFGMGDLMFVVVLGAMLAFALWRMIHHARARRRALDGLHAELAVAQCLTPLIAEGAMVFHDVPANGFNLDHVVVAPGAVFAIETKSRRKPAERGKASARVRYDNQQLFFPQHTEIKPIEQADYQARWLESYLREGGIEQVRVIPVVALPGWYVDSEKSVFPRVLVNNCTNSSFMLRIGSGTPLPQSVRKSIGQLITHRYPSPAEPRP